MKKIFLFLALTAVPYISSAQKFTAGVELGFNNAVKRASVITSTQIHPLQTGTLPDMGIGIHAEWHFYHFSLGMGLNSDAVRFTINPQIGDGEAMNFTQLYYWLSNNSIPVYLSYYKKLNEDFALKFKLGLSGNQFLISGGGVSSGGGGAQDSFPVETTDEGFPDQGRYYKTGFVAGISLRPLNVMKHFTFSLEYNNVFGITGPSTLSSTYTHGGFKESATYNASLRPVYFSVKIGYELGKLPTGNTNKQN
jgi:hypothetical protein